MRPLVRKIFLFGMVLELGLLACAGNERSISATRNRGAALVGELPANPLQWKVISSQASLADSTMATLFGNDLAIEYVRANSQHNYPNGSALALVTWTQREDDRWYGAKIPAQARSVEFVFVSAAADGHPAYSYQKFEGTPLKKTSAQEQVGKDRLAYLLSQRAAVMP
jgi:Cytochrome P460